MIKLVKIALIMTLLLALSAPGSGAEAKKSQERRKRVEDIIKNYKKAGLDLEDHDVYELILKDVSKFIELEPKGKPDLRSSKVLFDEVSAVVNEKFPASAQEIVKEAEDEAVNKFKMAEILDQVEVIFQKGEVQYKAKGIFYGFGGNSVQVDDKVIAIYDLSPEHRIKFDKEYCARKKKDYINNKVQGYYSRKAEFSLQSYKACLAKQYEQNENLGYILAWKEWRTPKSVIDLTIKSLNKGKLPKPPTDKDVPAGETKDLAKAPADTPPIENPDDYKNLSPAERAMKKANDNLIRIRRLNAGIDADQGYKLATWGMTHEEVNYLFPNEIKSDSVAEVEPLLYNEGPIKKVELHFYQNYLNKVTISFITHPKESVIELSNQLYERYGKSDEQKEAELKAAEEEEGKEGEAPAPPPAEGAVKPEDIPQVSVFTWTGIQTKAVTTVRLDEQKMNFTSFELVKEAVGQTEKIDEKLKKQKEEAEQKKREEILKKVKKGVEF